MNEYSHRVPATPMAGSLLLQWWPVSLLGCMLFFTLAMTTDAVGNIIPEVIKEFSLSLQQGGAFHYSTMIGIAISGIALGHLADRLGHRTALIVGLAMYGLSCLLFMFGDGFYIFVGLLFIGGLAIGIFKTSALALISDITRTSEEHTRTMNVVEGFYAIGSIVGPYLVAMLLNYDIAWQYLYLCSSILCLILLVSSAMMRLPPARKSSERSASFSQTLSMLKDPHALFFSVAVALYVATEVAVYVWMPTLFLEYTDDLYDAAKWALMIFFILRALGRFLGWLVLARFSWTSVMMWLALLIFLCYLFSLILGVGAGVILLPLSGLFMSMIYPTLNSKGISCFPKNRHSSVAGLILFFTAVAAAVSPWLMGLVGDVFGHIKYGFVLMTGFAALLLSAMIYNHLCQPAARRLDETSTQSEASIPKPAE